MQLVVLAAGYGRRFGGLKQLAPVGPNGEALMDYTAASALAAGFDEVVLIVRDEVTQELLEHVEQRWPGELAVTPVTQGPIAGTAQAVASAAPYVSGPFGVANADDLYGDAGFATLGRGVGALATRGGTPGPAEGGPGDRPDDDRATSDSPGEHLIVGYRLAATIIGDGSVTRGICRVDESGYLRELVEHRVSQEAEGRFVARPIHAAPESPGIELTGDEQTSMNLWGFSPDIFGHLEAALAEFDPQTEPSVDSKPPELLLPSVVGALVAAGRARVRVPMTEGRCIGITHPDDLPVVRALLAGGVVR